MIAWLIDRVVVTIPGLLLVTAAILRAAYASDEPLDGPIDVAVILFAFFCDALYQLPCNVTGVSLGKWACGLRVARLSDGQRPGTLGLLRYIVAVPMAWTLPLSLPAFAMSKFNDKRQAAHDYASGTVVVRTRRRMSPAATLEPA